MEIQQRAEGYTVTELDGPFPEPGDADWVYVVRQTYRDDHDFGEYITSMTRDRAEALRIAEAQYREEMHADNTDRLASGDEELRAECSEITVVAWPFDQPGAEQRWSKREITLYRIAPDFSTVAPRLTGEEFLARFQAAKSGAEDAFDGVEIPTVPDTLVTVLTEAGLNELDEATDFLHDLLEAQVGATRLDWIWNNTLDGLRHARATPVDRALTGFWAGLDDAAAALTRAEKHRQALTDGLHPDYAGNAGEGLRQVLDVAVQAVRAVNAVDPLLRPLPFD